MVDLRTIDQAGIDGPKTALGLGTLRYETWFGAELICALETNKGP